MNSELEEALAKCNTPLGVSSEGYIPAKEQLGHLVDIGFLEIVKIEVVGGWRQYEWFRTTEAGRKLLCRVKKIRSGK